MLIRDVMFDGVFPSVLIRAANAQLELQTRPGSSHQDPGASSVSCTAPEAMSDIHTSE